VFVQHVHAHVHPVTHDLLGDVSDESFVMNLYSGESPTREWEFRVRAMKPASRLVESLPPRPDDAYVTAQSVLYSPFDYDCPLSEGSRHDSMKFVHFFPEMYG
jgi:hypothetical protein